MSLHPHHHASENPPNAGGRDCVCVRIEPDMLQTALQRLISTGNPRTGAQRLIKNATAYGIDLRLVWGVLSDESSNEPLIKQVCMVVPGAGGTGMCFLSNPKLDPLLGDQASQIHHISVCLGTAIDELPQIAGDQVRLVQTLFEPEQHWLHDICQQASMISVGTLDYLRMNCDLIALLPEYPESWPEGIEVRAMRDLKMEAQDDDGSLLGMVLEGSYQDTLDCPEMCGMRTMRDVIASHESTGVFDPSRWFLLFKDGRPVGCCLLSHCPSNESVELVYLGLCPSVRGSGLGTRLLCHGLRGLRLKDRCRDITCAVDRRNVPAAKVYAGLGFKRFDARCGYVLPVKSPV